VQRVSQWKKQEREKTDTSFFAISFHGEQKKNGEREVFLYKEFKSIEKTDRKKNRHLLLLSWRARLLGVAGARRDTAGHATERSYIT
jgi:hypothetical protein